KKNKLTKPQKKNRTLFSILSGIKQKIFKTTISSISNSTQNFSKVGEIHLWMYDKYSLRRLLTNNGFKNISFVTAFDSNLPDWKKFELDGKNGIIRKPDSLFTEAFK
ncbi:MAG: hypothetical protein ABIN97_19950, partial [Ginsengibacter sp.]